MSSDDNRTKLEKTFDLPKSESELIDALNEMYNFSEDPDLSEVAKLALTAYREQLKDIIAMEPKYRSRALEVAAQYLNLAKDALGKAEDLRLKEEKQNRDSGNGSEDDDEDKESFDRNDILIELDKIRKGKK